MAFDLSSLANYLQIVFINLVLSGDNVVVISMAAAGLAPNTRTRAVFVGIIAATLVRIGFSLIAVRLLAVTGLLLAGGLLLGWVCWKMFEELRQHDGAASATSDMAASATRHEKTFGSAVTQIIVADVSMSLDNVLAVAGAAQQNMGALVFGLVLSVGLMGLAATQIAKLLSRYRWIGWIGLAIIACVAANMVRHGTLELLAPR